MKKFNFVYIVTNLIDNKQYIGSHETNNLNDRYLGGGVYIKYEVKKLGKQNFKIEILKECENIRDARNLEEFYIKKYNTLIPNGYNKSKSGGICGKSDWNHSDESIKKIKESHIGQIPWNKGKINILSEETKEKMRLSHLGKKHSEETKKRISNNSKGIIRNHSAETKQKIGLANKGKKRSPEQIERIRLSKIGKTLSESSKNKLSKSKTGTKHSEET